MENEKDLNIMKLFLAIEIFVLMWMIFLWGGRNIDYIRLFTSVAQLILGVLLWFAYGKIRNSFTKVVIVISVVAMFIIGAYNFLLSF